MLLMADHPGKDVDFHKRVVNEYKEGKVFRPFDSVFLKDVLYHQISPESEYSSDILLPQGHVHTFDEDY